MITWEKSLFLLVALVLLVVIVDKIVQQDWVACGMGVSVLFALATSSVVRDVYPVRWQIPRIALHIASLIVYFYLWLFAE